MKTSPYALPTKIRPIITKEFVDPDCPQLVYKMNFRMPRSIDVINMESLVEHHNEIYLTGSGERDEYGNVLKDKPGYIAPRVIPPVGTEIVIVTEGSVRIITYIYCCQISQAPDGVSDLYDFEEIAAMMAGSDALAHQITMMYNDICRHIENLGKSLINSETPGEQKSSEE